MTAALAKLWERHCETNRERVVLVEETAAELIRGRLSEAQRAEGVSAAHKLAGSLGTFGYEEGSRVALEVETLLGQPSVAINTLAEAVAALRREFDQAATATGAGGGSGIGPANGEAESIIPAGIDLALVTNDGDLGARLTNAATGVGLTSTVAPLEALEATLDPTGPIPPARPSLTVVDAADFAPAAFADLIVRLAPKIPLAVLTEADTLEDRLDLTKAGVVAVIPRTQDPAVAMEFVATTVLGDRGRGWTIRLLTRESGIVDTLDEALPESENRFIHHRDPESLWAGLEDEETDLVVLDGDVSPELVADLCRVIRSDLNHRWTPVVSFGSMSSEELGVAIDAGLNWHFSSSASSAALRARLRSIIGKARSDRSTALIDRLTGLQNREAAGRSLDRLLRLSNRWEEPFTLGLVAVDRFEELVAEHGAVLGDLVLRRLAETMQELVTGTDTVGRWSSGQLVIGFGRTGRQVAETRLLPLLDRFANEQMVGPDGQRVSAQTRWHLASSPNDGTKLVSLERRCESGLTRTGPARQRAAEEVDVIVVEDDDSVADVVSYALDLRGYRSSRFVDGAEAAQALSSGEVAGRVILLDVGLPSLDGFGVLHRLRSQGVLDESHLIMLTARSSETERLRALELGAQEHMAKPFSVPLLLGRLDQVLAGTGS